MIGLIYSQSSNGFIGKDGNLLFSIPEDMKRFKEITEGGTVIMGRKTWDSIPIKFKPLPNRQNFVLSSNSGYLNSQMNYYPGLRASYTLRNVLEVCLQVPYGNNNIWIIGGETLYKEGIEYADVIEQTFVTKEFDGDAKAPYIDPVIWTAEVGKHFKEYNGLYYQFNTYRRIKS